MSPCQYRYKHLKKTPQDVCVCFYFFKVSVFMLLNRGLNGHDPQNSHFSSPACLICFDCLFAWISMQQTLDEHVWLPDWGIGCDL